MASMLRVAAWLVAAGALASACGGGAAPTLEPLGREGEAGPTVEPPDRGVATLKLISTEFRLGHPIPAQYTCDGEGISPPLYWSAVPGETEAFTLIMDDPDAGGFVHWVLYDIDPSRASLVKGAGAVGSGALAASGIPGQNSFGDLGYGGPCPPDTDPAHTYQFFIYALDQKLGLEPGASANAVVEAIQGHVLGVAQVNTSYRRR